MKRRVLAVLIVLNLAFIWGNSALPGDASSELSGGVLDILNRILPFLQTEWGHTLIRKIGHFSEFACLGLLSAWLRRTEKGTVCPSLMGAGLAVGCIDETIQIYIPGRASGLIDVWIDTAGFAAGLVLLTAGAAIWNRTKLWRNKI